MKSKQPEFKPAWLHSAEVQTLVEVFARNKVEIRFVGGCVRDTLLGRDVTDIDVATQLLPDATIELLKREDIRTIPTGIDHGTITALINGRHFEITTLRRDEECFGRHADVAYTEDWKEDAARRDFTINALYAAPDGTLYDYHDGLADLEPPLVRFIGDAADRIREDALRILRFFRFNVQLATKSLDKDGLKACGELASLVKDLSGERIADEMYKLLAAREIRSEILAAMQQCDALLEQLKLPSPPASLSNLSHHQEGTIIQERLACWLLASGDSKALSARWKLSNRDSALLAFLVSEAPRISANTPEKELKKLLRQIDRERYRALMRVASAHTGKEAILGHLALSESWQIPVFPLSGKDLIEEGWSSGPELGQVLKRLEAWWEEENYTPSRDELIKRSDKS